MDKTISQNYTASNLYKGKVADEVDEWVCGFLISSNVIFQTKETMASDSNYCGVGTFEVISDTVERL